MRLQVRARHDGHAAGPERLRRGLQSGRVHHEVDARALEPVHQPQRARVVRARRLAQEDGVDLRARLDRLCGVGPLASERGRGPAAGCDVDIPTGSYFGLQDFRGMSTSRRRLDSPRRRRRDPSPLSSRRRRKALGEAAPVSTADRGRRRGRDANIPAEVGRGDAAPTGSTGPFRFSARPVDRRDVAPRQQHRVAAADPRQLVDEGAERAEERRVAQAAERAAAFQLRERHGRVDGPVAVQQAAVV